MQEEIITVDIHCTRPPWAITNTNAMLADSKYRLYVNDHLITERTWIWDNNTFLNENVSILADLNVNYSLRIEPVVHIPEQANFNLTNLKVNNRGVVVDSSNDYAISFKIINIVKESDDENV